MVRCTVNYFYYIDLFTVFIKDQIYDVVYPHFTASHLY